MNAIAFAVCLFLCWSSCVQCSQPWSKEAIANTCGGGEKLLCDLDHVLNATEAASLSSLLLEDLGSEGDCPKKIYVVIIRHLANPYGQEISTKMEQAAEHLREQWKGECSAISVLLLSTGDGLVWTRFCEQSGLCFAAVKGIYKSNRHYLLDQKQYGVGLQKFIRAYQNEIKTPDHCAVEVSTGVRLLLILFFPIFAVILLGFTLILCFCCGWINDEEEGNGHHGTGVGGVVCPVGGDCCAGADCCLGFGECCMACAEVAGGFGGV